MDDNTRVMLFRDIREIDGLIDDLSDVVDETGDEVLQRKLQALAFASAEVFEYLRGN